jgi:hypothetical protein
MSRSETPAGFNSDAIGDVAPAKDGDGLPRGEPCRAWQNYRACFPGHVQRSECESCAIARQV